MNIYFFPSYMRKKTACAQILSPLNNAEIINQHTLLKFRAYAETGQNNKITRLCICVFTHHINELKKVML